MSISDAPGTRRGVKKKDLIITPDDKILVTGAAGFIGNKVVEVLIQYGFHNLRCFIRPSGNRARLDRILDSLPWIRSLEIMEGNLLSEQDCMAATRDVAVIYHLAAARGEKSFPDAFMNSVVTTRNLLKSTLENRALKRFVNVSSFSVYSNTRKRGMRLDESCPLEPHPELRGDAYCFAKVKQEAVVTEYSRQHGIPCVTFRPGFVFGPGNEGITGRVGISGFGVFLHLGGSNQIPFTYVDNCAEAIVLGGLRRGVDGETFNVVDDDLPTSRRFLAMYKKNVCRFKSLYVPHAVSYLLCYLWEKYSSWSEGQLPPVYNRKNWHAYWKRTRYTNEKLKNMLGWQPRVPADVAFDNYFGSCRLKRKNA